MFTVLLPSLGVVSGVSFLSPLRASCAGYWDTRWCSSPSEARPRRLREKADHRADHSPPGRASVELARHPSTPHYQFIYRVSRSPWVLVGKKCTKLNLLLSVVGTSRFGPFHNRKLAENIFAHTVYSEFFSTINVIVSSKKSLHFLASQKVRNAHPRAKCAHL